VGFRLPCGHHRVTLAASQALISNDGVHGFLLSPASAPTTAAPAAPPTRRGRTRAHADRTLSTADARLVRGRRAICVRGRDAEAGCGVKAGKRQNRAEQNICNLQTFGFPTFGFPTFGFEKRDMHIHSLNGWCDLQKLEAGSWNLEVGNYRAESGPNLRVRAESEIPGRI